MSWEPICSVSEIPLNAGIAALINGKQVALFHLEDEFYAIDNFDPVSKVNSLSRGIIGSIGEEPCIASPLYKQHYSLKTGQCLEESELSIKTYLLRCSNGMVEINSHEM